MTRPLLSRYLLFVCASLPWTTAACTSRYVFEFRNAESGAPVVGVPVSASSLPRIYSFLDPRHYIVETGEAVVAGGRTDEAGRATIELPSGLGVKCVMLGAEWVAQEPSREWQPMRPMAEYQTRSREADAQTGPRGPLVRMQTR